MTADQSRANQHAHAHAHAHATAEQVSDQGSLEVPDPDAVMGNGTVSESLEVRRRRAAGGSSRGVANLTPAQLAKKRANDREAQR
jgi:hypothetical protein